MIKASKNENFSRHEFDALGIRVYKSDLLQSYYLVRHEVPGFKDVAVGSLSDLNNRDPKRGQSVSPTRNLKTLAHGELLFHFPWRL